MVVLGTRPEAIKLAPLIRELCARAADFECDVWSSGQHGDMLAQALVPFDIRPDVDLQVMRDDQTLAGLSARLFEAIDRQLAATTPDWLLVQGDTTTAYVAAMCAFYRGVRVGHVEAGLRTHDRAAPFPEEINRVMIGRVADLHFAPTLRAAENLRHEGVLPGVIHVTGNTSVDAVMWARDRVHERWVTGAPADVPPLPGDQRLVLMTGHRRESFGAGLKEICLAVRRLVEEHDDIAVIYPVHLNPNVDGPVRRLIGDHPRIHLCAPVGYLELVWLLDRAYLVVTDSGGIQEEAPSFRKPVLVTRKSTERPEAVDVGCARLVGTNGAELLARASKLLESRREYDSMIRDENPFGDGKAATRIVDALASSAATRW